MNALRAKLHFCVSVYVYSIPRQCLMFHWSGLKFVPTPKIGGPISSAGRVGFPCTEALSLLQHPRFESQSGALCCVTLPCILFSVISEAVLSIQRPKETRMYIKKRTPKVICNIDSFKQLLQNGYSYQINNNETLTLPKSPNWWRYEFSFQKCIFPLAPYEALFLQDMCIYFQARTKNIQM